MKELSIELIFANTAQAKGRIEKVNRTFLIFLNTKLFIFFFN